MKRSAKATLLTLGILMLALLFTTASYAKLVVLSANFTNSTDGFASSTTSNCGATFTVRPSSNGLALNAAAPTSCAGTFQLDKLVVLSSIPHPSFEVSLTDASNKVNLAGSGVTLNGHAYSFSWDGQGSRKHGVANLAALNGQAVIHMVIRFNAGTRGFVINNVILNSN